MPPQTPNSMRLSRASARHSYRTGQLRQMRLATFCSAPSTNKASGSPFRHAARLGQSMTILVNPRPPLYAPSAGPSPPLGPPPSRIVVNPTTLGTRQPVGQRPYGGLVLSREDATSGFPQDHPTP